MKAGEPPSRCFAPPPPAWSPGPCRRTPPPPATPSPHQPGWRTSPRVGWSSRTEWSCLRRFIKSLTSLASIWTVFILIRIRIQHFRLNTDPDPDPIRIQGFYDQKLEKKILAEKNYIFFWIKNYNLPIPRPPKRTSKLQKRLQLSKNFCPPDLESEYGSGSRSTDLTESGSETLASTIKIGTTICVSFMIFFPLFAPWTCQY